MQTFLKWMKRQSPGPKYGAAVAHLSSIVGQISDGPPILTRWEGDWITGVLSSTVESSIDGFSSQMYCLEGWSSWKRGLVGG